MKKLLCVTLALALGLTSVLYSCKKRDENYPADSAKGGIEEKLQFATQSVASYYELLMSDNENLADIINGIEKQADDKDLLHDEISSAIDKIKEMLPDVFSDDAKEYMAARLFCESCSLVFGNEYEQIIQSDYQVAAWEIIDEYLVCKVDCTIEYQTVQRNSSDLPIMSKIAEQTQLVIENSQKPMILDWYCDDPASFDAKIRTYALNLFHSDDWLSNMEKERLSEKLIGQCIETFIGCFNNVS